MIDTPDAAGDRDYEAAPDQGTVVVKVTRDPSFLRFSIDNGIVLSTGTHIEIGLVQQTRGFDSMKVDRATAAIEIVGEISQIEMARVKMLPEAAFGLAGNLLTALVLGGKVPTSELLAMVEHLRSTADRMPTDD